MEAGRRTRILLGSASLLAAAALAGGCGMGGDDGSAVEAEGLAVTSAGSEVLERRTEQLPMPPPARTTARARAQAPPLRPEIRTYRAGEAGVVRVQVGRRCG
ncbi:MAG: hypothetical protein RLN63_09600 [Miltoncostaeaceae bacterium]